MQRQRISPKSFWSYCCERAVIPANAISPKISESFVLSRKRIASPAKHWSITRGTRRSKGNCEQGLEKAPRGDHQAWRSDRPDNRKVAKPPRTGFLEERATRVLNLALCS